MPISFPHKAVFIHIPKTGGQSISAMLGIQKGNPNHFYYEGLTHLTLPMIEERIDIDGMYIFTFVRNPYDKIVSEYAWRMRNRHSVIYNEPTRDLMSFPNYMELLLRRWDKLVSAHREKAHVLPQVDFLDDRIEIYKYENYEAECARLKVILNINKSILRINVGKYNTQHTERTREITRMLYAEDFKRLNYEL